MKEPTTAVSVGVSHDTKNPAIKAIGAAGMEYREYKNSVSAGVLSKYLRKSPASSYGMS
jgi:hypothetical protein